MIPLRAGELSNIRRTQTNSLPDTCVLLQKSQIGTDAYNQPKTVEGTSAAIACGLQQTNGAEVTTGSQSIIADAVLRLPLSQLGLVKNADRVKITHKNGEALATPLVYDIAGSIAEGPSGLVLALRLWK